MNVYRHLAYHRRQVVVFLLAFSILSALLFFPFFAQAERAQRIDRTPPKGGFPSISMFHNLRVKDQFRGKLIHLDEKKQNDAKAEEVKASAASTIVPDHINASQEEEILPPDQDPQITAEKDAPSPIKGMVRAMNVGDRGQAKAYADQYVRYLRNYFFYVRDMTQLIGESLIDQGVIDEDNWVGVEQHFSYEMAKTRQELGSLIKPTHETAMQRIEPDPKNQAQIYVFFTLNCSWCRYMSADLERLWQMVKDDPNVKMAAYTLGATPNDWISEYRSYTGLTLPILDGTDLARAFKVAYVPAVVIVAPNGDRAYLKTGQQSFQNLYEFVRRVQGLPATVTKRYLALQESVIGEMERAKVASLKKPGAVSAVSYRVTRTRKKDSLERF